MLQRFVVTLLAALSLSGCTPYYMAEAQRADSEGRYEDARRNAGEALRLDPDYRRARALLGTILLHSGADALAHNDLESARFYFKEAARVDPANTEVAGYLEIVRKAEERQPAPAVATPRSETTSPRTETKPPPAPREAAKPAVEHAREAPVPAPKEEPTPGRALRRTVSLYAEPSPLAGELGKLPAGTSVSVLREVGAWNEVETRDGKRGYVAADAVE